MVNAMLLNSGAPENLWGEAILSSCYILNRVTVKDNDKTPYELWKKRSPSLDFLKVWGCYVNLTSTPPGKQNERRSLYFIGSCLSGGYTNKTCHASKFSIIRPHNQSIQVC